MPPYASARVIGYVVVALFGVLILFSVIAAVTHLRIVAYLNSALRGNNVSEAEGNSLDLQLGFASIGQLLMLLALVITFLWWFRSSYKNLRALGSRHVEFTTGWAVGGWFVPFLNLVRPYQIAKEIWIKSYPRGVQQSSRRAPAVGSAPVLIWWLLYLAMNIFDRVVTSFGQESDKLQGPSAARALISDNNSAVVLEVLRVLAAIAACYLVITIVRWQDKRHELIEAMPAEGDVEPGTESLE